MYMSMSNSAPEKIYLQEPTIVRTQKMYDNDIEYTRTDAFIAKVINFLNYKLDDIVAIQNPDSIIPQHIVKPELIEDLKKYIEEYNV